MLKRVEPLRDELRSLEDQASLNMKNATDTKELVAQLEQSIAAYKEEYAQLISQAQAIKTDLENVQAKVDRSIALLKSLNIERDRWEATSETFRSQMSTIIGDVLLSAAFIAYGNFWASFFYIKLKKVAHSNSKFFFQVATSINTTEATCSQHGVNIYKQRTFNTVRILHEQSTYRIQMNDCVGKQMHCQLMICARKMRLC